jgi:hypothetical protein
MERMEKQEMQDARPQGATPSRAPDCLKCSHFHVSWDPAFPRACRVFAIKSRQLPSHAVYQATGRHCPAFERSSRLKEP